MKKNILVLIPVNEEHKRLLEEKAPSAAFTYATSDTINQDQVHNANIIIGNVPIDMIKDSNKLEWLQLESAGVGDYIKDNALPENTMLTNASGAYGLAISEYMLGVLLSLLKKLYLYRDNQAERNWSYLGQVKPIYKSTALIVGLGDIGGEFAKRLKLLGAYTIGVRRKDTNKPDFLDELYMMDKFEDLLPRADIIALSLPGTSLTNKIINEKTIKIMKRDAVIINVGRGNVIDTEALCDALENEDIAGVALDVTDPEPLPKDHRLWGIKNAVITPHASGRYSLQDIHDKIVKISADNLEAYLNGKDLINIVDFPAGY